MSTVEALLIGVVVLNVIALGLALLAGLGWGAAYAYERLRPERMARETHAHVRNTIEEMRAVHDEATATLLARQTPKPGTSM